MSRFEHASRLVTLVALVAIAAACGGGGAATAGPTTGNEAATLGPAGTAAGSPVAGGGGAGVQACDLLTDADIEEITGSKVTERLDYVEDTVYVNHCRWNLDAGEINLGVVSPGGKAFYEERVGIINGLEPVEGLTAEIAMRQELTGSIFAVANDALVDLFTIGVSAPDEEIVARVLENLERM